MIVLVGDGGDKSRRKAQLAQQLGSERGPVSAERREFICRAFVLEVDELELAGIALGLPQLLDDQRPDLVQQGGIATNASPRRLIPPRT